MENLGLRHGAGFTAGIRLGKSSGPGDCLMSLEFQVCRHVNAGKISGLSSCLRNSSQTLEEWISKRIAWPNHALARRDKDAFVPSSRFSFRD